MYSKKDSDQATRHRKSADYHTYPMFPGVWSNLYNEDKQCVHAMRTPAHLFFVVCSLCDQTLGTFLE